MKKVMSIVGARLQFVEAVVVSRFTPGSTTTPRCLPCFVASLIFRSLSTTLASAQQDMAYKLVA